MPYKFILITDCFIAILRVVDASQGGVGDMEIMINEGQVPCGVQNRGNRLFRATFTPRDALPHYIDLRFNGMDVPGLLHYNVTVALKWDLEPVFF